MADSTLEIPVEDPVYSVQYNGTGIGADISEFVTQLSYTDHEHGQSDEVEITCEDRDHRWKQSWYPDVAARLSVTLGYADGRELRCGDFELDEIEFAGPPDTVRIKAIATVFTPSLRTQQSFGYENTTLKSIVDAVAKRNELTVRGDIEEIALDRITQNHERDLPFLLRLAEDYGYAFSVRGSYLDFWKIRDLESAGAVLTLRRGAEIKSFTLSEKTEQTYPEGEVAYHDPNQKARVDGQARRSAKTGDIHSLLKRAPAQGLAAKQADAHLHGKDKKQLSGTVTVVGDTRLVAGINVQLGGLHKLDGKWHVQRSSHRLSRSGGYESEAEIYRVST